MDSILGQTFTDFELILVNDGGNEAETTICEEYVEKDSRIITGIKTIKVSVPPGTSVWILPEANG
ncbi:MAG: glycosyltransferase family 2 protein [Lachnospiraceae bacterium]|nr:glycosyltransferase family 2 protein [Lachnospiraceae bacterium]